MYLTFHGGQAWVTSTPPASNPADNDLIPNISEMTISISPETVEKGPYLGGTNAKLAQVTSVTAEASFTVDVPRLASPTLDLLRVSAASGANVWFRYREGAAGDTGSTTYTFTDAIVTSLESAGGEDGIVMSVTVRGRLTITS